MSTETLDRAAAAEFAPRHRLASDSGERRDGTIAAHHDRALGHSAWRTGRRACGSVVAAVAPCLSRGLDPRLCRRLSRDHDCFRHRQSNGAADAQGGCARSAVIGRALTGPALKRFSESRRGGFEWKAGGIYAHTGIDRTGLVSSPPVLGIALPGCLVRDLVPSCISQKRKSRRCQRGSPEKPSGFPPPAAQYKWQATMCCEATSLWTGASPAHCGMAYGQRGWKRQPEGGSSALGTSPVMVSFSCLSSGCDGKAAVDRGCA